MRLHVLHSRAELLALHLFVAAGGSGYFRADFDPTSCDRVAEQTLERHRARPAVAEQTLRTALKQCGEGHGINAALAHLAAGRHDLAEAVSQLRSELLVSHPSTLAFRTAAELAAQLPPKLSADLLQVGSSLPLALMTDSLEQYTSWQTSVVCPSGVKGQTRGFGHPPAIHEVVTCADGTVHNLWVVESWALAEPADGAAPAGWGSTTGALSEVMPKVTARFDIRTPQQLRRAVEAISAENPSRSDAWLLSWLHDVPGTSRAWRKILKRDPSDLEATLNLQSDLTNLGDLRGAQEVLKAAPVDQLRLRDTRGTQSIAPSGIATRLCEILWRQGQEAAARQECLRSLKLGSRAGANRVLAMIAYSHGQLEEALRYADVALSYTTPDVWAENETLRGRILLDLKRPVEAQATFAAVIQARPDYTPAHLAAAGRPATAAEWDAVVVAHDRTLSSTWLAGCGHLYLELDLRARADECFLASERVERGPADAALIQHLAESSPAAALQLARKLDTVSAHPAVLSALAQVELQNGHPAEAQRSAARALRLDPGLVDARELLKQSCGTPSPSCDALRDPP